MDTPTTPETPAPAETPTPTPTPTAESPVAAPSMTEAGNSTTVVPPIEGAGVSQSTTENGMTTSLTETPNLTVPSTNEANLNSNPSLTTPSPAETSVNIGAATPSPEASSSLGVGQGLPGSAPPAVPQGSGLPAPANPEGIVPPAATPKVRSWKNLFGLLP